MQRGRAGRYSLLCLFSGADITAAKHTPSAEVGLLELYANKTITCGVLFYFFIFLPYRSNGIQLKTVAFLVKKTCWELLPQHGVGRVFGWDFFRFYPLQGELWAEKCLGL